MSLTTGSSQFTSALPLGSVADTLVDNSSITDVSPKKLTGLKENIVTALWEVVDRHPWVLSTTFTGSFLLGDSLDGISDIDLVVIADELNAERFAAIQSTSEQALLPLMQEAGLALRINPTLGPLKLNDQKTAVLHLMMYSKAAHVDHAINSPFTCFDWQRSTVYRKQPLAAVYPVFALQPHHFVSRRRAVREYLNDYRAGVISYRELQCDATACREERQQQPMTVRCRHEFAYHILRFLMRNLLKLIGRNNDPPDGSELVAKFVRLFPIDADEVRRLYDELSAKKKSGDFSWPAPDLDRRLEVFVTNFESQFRRMFFTEATRHIVFRHAPTVLNAGVGENRRFVGRSNPEIAPVEEALLEPLLTAIADDSYSTAFVSPLLRCQQTYELLSAHLPLPEPTVDNRLLEIDYGRCEAQTVAVARKNNPELFTAWQRGEDPPFPGGEGTDDVCSRALGFVDDRWSAADGPTITCTHNIVIRSLLGQALLVPRPLWHRLLVPHLVPITFVQTRSHGWFVDLDEAVERQIFSELAK